jgi:SAM-dependent methyltransferase
VVSQEALLHVPDKGRALAEAFRILRPGGRLAFTDWACHVPLSQADAALMWEGMAAQTLQSLPDYRKLLEAAGFRIVSIEDLTVSGSCRSAWPCARQEAQAAGSAAGSNDREALADTSCAGSRHGVPAKKPISGRRIACLVMRPS